jgi:putative DNA primase/helicase
VVLYETVRYEHETKKQERKPGKPAKTFRVRRPMPDRPGWFLPSRGDRPLVVFRLDRLVATPDVDLHWTEGEDHALALEGLGFLATTTMHGATGVRAYDLATLRNAARTRHVIVHADADADGEAYATFVATAIAPVARSVRIVSYADLGPGGDVLDCIRKGASRDELERRMAAAPLWKSPEGAAPAPTARLVVRNLAEVTPQPVDWLWLRWLARGKFHLFAGHPGDGKSSLTAAIAAIGSVGGSWPDGTQAPRFRTLFILGEDSLADTLRPRLDCFGADVSQIHAIELVLDAQGRERFFDVGKLLDLLEQAIDAYGIELVVIDPLSSTLVGADRNAEGDMRDRLTPLVKAAERRDVAVLGIAHTGKPTGTTRTPLQRVLGSTGLVALARLVWMTAQDGDQRAFGVVKSNLAPRPAAQAWSRDEDGPICWHGQASQAIEDLLAETTPKLQRADAEVFLREVLVGGSRTAREVEQAAQEAGISKATLRRAADDLGVLKSKSGGPGTPWYWRLPSGEPRVAASEEASAKVLTPKDAQLSILGNGPISQAPAQPGHAEGAPPMGRLENQDGKGAHRSALSGEHLWTVASSAVANGSLPTDASDHGGGMADATQAPGEEIVL